MMDKKWRRPRGPPVEKIVPFSQKIWYTKGKIFKSGKVGGSDGRWNSPVPWKQGRSDLPGDTNHIVLL